MDVPIEAVAMARQAELIKGLLRKNIENGIVPRSEYGSRAAKIDAPVLAHLQSMGIDGSVEDIAARAKCGWAPPSLV